METFRKLKLAEAQLLAAVTAVSLQWHPGDLASWLKRCLDLETFCKLKLADRQLLASVAAAPLHPSPAALQLRMVAGSIDPAMIPYRHMSSGHS